MPVVGYCRNLHTNLCPCFICAKKFSLDNGVEDLLTHICFTHRVVIENIDQIADFRKYMEYYVKRHREVPLESFTRQFSIEVSEGNNEPREQKYYLLGDFLVEDENLRKSLHAKRLKAAQKQQRLDLSPQYFVRHCFYCHQTLEATNAQFINHLRNHGFQLGHPEKLVYIDKFIEAIEDTFRNLRCLYCEMEFESYRALIFHMEKKGHLKIHANNRFYDQFYIINYLEFGKTWLDFVKEKNKMPEEKEEVKINDDPDWSSWGTEPENIMCLFCKHICRSWEGTLLHMQVSHNFDFKSAISNFNFYQQVKAVNYIRRRILDQVCVNCDYRSEDINDVVNHMEKANHLTIPDQNAWDHSEYLYCSLENDMFLFHLEDNGDENDNEECIREMNTTNQLLTQSKNDQPQNERDHSNSSPGAGTNSPIDELDLGVDISKMKHDIKLKELIPSEDITINDDDVLRSKEIELRSAANVGAGDSIDHKVIITDDQKNGNIKRINEFGDA